MYIASRRSFAANFQILFAQIEMFVVAF